MSKIFAVALGILTAIGGFLDIGDLVTNAVVGSRFGLALAWVVPVGVLGICLYANMAGRVAAVSGTGHVRDHPGTARPASRGGEPVRLVLHQLDDADRRDRRCGIGSAAGHRCRPDDVDPGRRVRRLGGDLAGEVLDHGERHRDARPVPDRLRGQCLCAASRIGASWSTRPPRRSSRRRSRRPPTGISRSRCSVPR